MSFSGDRLYQLLPAIYRVRDQLLKDPTLLEEEPAALEALFKAIGEQVEVLEENLDQLYDDQFIETCAEWVVPYIGDLTGTRGIISFPNAPFSQRGQVAKTITYRRRKGTVGVLEQLAFDVTGWRANVVEYFSLLSATQFLNHLRPEHQSMASLRNRVKLEYLNSPFDNVAHSVDVRRIEPKRGKYNIPNIGIFLWRIQSHRLLQSPAFKVDDRRYTFDPLGRSIKLFNKPEPEFDITHLAEPIHLPLPIRRLIFSKAPEVFYGLGKSILIFVDGHELKPSDILLSPPSGEITDAICVCDLSDVPGGGSNPDWSNLPVNKIGIDPALGRIALPENLLVVPTSIRINYYYGFPANLGGGGYSRLQNFDTELQPVVRIPNDQSTIANALNSLGANGGVVEIHNNDYHDVSASIEINAGTKIEIRAAEGCRPVIRINGQWNVTGGTNAALSLNGLLICGGAIEVPLQKSSGAENEISRLQLSHCTLCPVLTPFDGASTYNPRLSVRSNDIKVNVAKSIIGGIRITNTAEINIIDSIIDVGDASKLAIGGISGYEFSAPLTIKNSTVIGRVKTRIMQLASNTIFHAKYGADFTELPVEVERLQEGCVRFSYVPIQSRVPRPYRCQPATESDAQRVKPVFTSLRYSDETYCQLDFKCPNEIMRGAENELEMGAFFHLYQPLREFNLRTRVNEYLRFGLEAGIYYGS